MTDRKPHSAARTRTTTTTKVAAKKTQAKKSPANKTAAKKTTTRKAAKTAPANKVTKKTPAKKTAKKTSAKVTAKTATKKTAAKKAAVKKTAKKTPAKKTPAKKTAAKKQPANAKKKTAKKRPAKAQRKPLPPAPRLSADVRARLQAILAAADADLRLSSEADAHAGGDALRELYGDDSWPMGTMWNTPLWSACGEAVARLEQLAETAARPTADFGGVTVASVFFVDVERPDTLLFAPSPEMPAVLFVPIPADVASVRTVLAEYSGQRDRSVELRAWMGFGSQLLIPNVYSGELGAVDDHELDRFFVFSPVATTLTRRTYFSASKFSYEQHGEDLFIWDLAWPACTTSPAVVSAFNKLTGYDFPRDMPVDLVAACEGFEFGTAAYLEARIPNEPENLPPILTVLAAIGWRNLATAERLREYMDGEPSVQGNLANVAFRYGWERMIWDLLRLAKDDQMQAQIGDALATLDYVDLPAPVGTRRVLPPGCEPAALRTLALARGWTPQADEVYTLPGHTESAPRRVTWIDVPTLLLSTLAIEGADDELPAIDAAFPDDSPADEWRAAAVHLWLGRDAELLKYVRHLLASSSPPEHRQIAARLIGHARLTAAADDLRAAIHHDPHATLAVALARIEPAADTPSSASREQ